MRETLCKNGVYFPVSKKAGSEKSYSCAGMGFTEISLQITDGLAVITLNRPQQMNAFTTTMSQELVQAMNSLSNDDSAKVIIVTGAGSAFCAGADLHTFTAVMKTGNAEEVFFRDPGGQVSLAVLACKKPVIAAINGTAVGIGITMTLAMDIRIAQEDAKIGFVFLRRGIVPEAASTYLLPRIVGVSKANELVMTGRIFPAQQEPTLFSHVVPKGSSVLDKAKEIARELMCCAPSSLALSKSLMLRGLEAKSAHEAHLNESKVLTWCFQESADAREGVMSFLEKRKPDWKVSPSTGLPNWEAKL